jgi:transketolase
MSSAYSCRSEGSTKPRPGARKTRPDGQRDPLPAPWTPSKRPIPVHPGLPMGAADIATVLFTRLSHEARPEGPRLADRDRFVLSAGHGSMLLYSLLYLTGYEDITIDEIKNFRQLGSKHRRPSRIRPYPPGIETTTGPLGQGIANAVGMAIAERKLNAGVRRPRRSLHLRARRRRLPDGRHQPGSDCACRAPEAQQAHRPVWDDNNISIDGPLSLSDSTDQHRPLPGLRAGTPIAVDGHDPEAIAAALEKPRRSSDKPTLIACKTTSASARRTRPARTRSHGSAARRRRNRRARKALAGTRKPSSFRPTF